MAEFWGFRAAVRWVAVSACVCALYLACAVNAFAIDGPIAGHVYDAETGAPLQGVSVALFDPYNITATGPAFITSTVTAADGSYSMTRQVDRSYIVAFVDSTGLYRDVTWPNRGLPVDSSFTVNPYTYQGDIDAHMPTKTYLKDTRVLRVWGETRYDTAVETSKVNFSHATSAVIVSGEQFPDALSASSLAAAVRGPLLLVKRDSAPAAVIAELQRLGVTKLYIVGGPSSVSEAVVTQFKGAGIVAVNRISGETRYGTSALVAFHVFNMTGKAKAPFICRGDVFPDALSVSPFAYMEARPILLVKPTSCPREVSSMWFHLTIKYGLNSVIVIGGPASITTPVIQTLADNTYSGTLYYNTIYGKDRYETNQKVIAAYEMPFDVMGLASGETFPDALAGGVGCGRLWGPVVLTKKTSLPSFASATIADHGQYSMLFEVLGGTAAVSQSVQNSAKAILDAQLVDEISGSSTWTANLGVAPIGVDGLIGSARSSLSDGPQELLSIDPDQLLTAN